MLKEAQKIIQDCEYAISKVILYSVDESKLFLGINKTIGILQGSKSNFFIERNLHNLETYGIFPNFTKDYLQKVISLLIESELLEIKMVSEYENLPTLKLTVKGHDFLSRINNTNTKISFMEKLANKEVIILDDTEKSLFEDLRKLRVKLALSRNVSSFIICNDKTLQEIVKIKPETLEVLFEVRGVGLKFVQNYGELFLKTIKQKNKEK